MWALVVRITPHVDKKIKFVYDNCLFYERGGWYEGGHVRCSHLKCQVECPVLSPVRVVVRCVRGMWQGE